MSSLYITDYRMLLFPEFLEHFLHIMQIEKYTLLMFPFVLCVCYIYVKTVRLA